MRNATAIEHTVVDRDEQIGIHLVAPEIDAFCVFRIVQERNDTGAKERHAKHVEHQCQCIPLCNQQNER
jgi:hypothetical protein